MGGLFVQRTGVAALMQEDDEAVARMCAVHDKRRKLMVKLLREVGFGIPVMAQGAFYVFADASRWTDDSYAYAYAYAFNYWRRPAWAWRRAWTSAMRGCGW